MSKGRATLFCVLTLLILQLNLAAPAALAAGCPFSSWHPQGHPTCNETCSKQPRIQFGDDFSCKVGYKQEWLSFNATYDLGSALTLSVSNQSISKRYLPQLLSSISMHPAPYEKKKRVSPALKITFDVSFKKEGFGLKAVLLTFESPTIPTDPSLTDELYAVKTQGDYNIVNDGRIYRLFNFDSYIPNTYDIDHPIPIIYSCLHSLDDCTGTGKVYSITLTTIKMNATGNQLKYFQCERTTCVLSSITYTISTAPDRYNNWNRNKLRFNKNKHVNWRATIATALYPTARDIYIVFERREGFIAQKVSLWQHNRTYKEKRLTSYSYTFKGLPAGDYNIKIEYCGISSKKCETHTAFHEITIEFGDKTSDPMKPPVIVAVITGIIAASFCLLLLAWFRCKRDKDPHGNTGRTIEELHITYTIFASHDEASRLLADQLQHKILPNLGVRKECIQHTTLINNIPSSSPVIVLLPVEHEMFQIRISNDTLYKQNIEQLMKRKGNKILIVYFPFLKGARCVRWSVLRKLKRICLIKDFGRLAKFFKVYRKNVLNFDEIRSDLETTLMRTIISLKKTPVGPINPPNLEHDSDDEFIIDEDCPIHGQFRCDRSFRDIEHHNVRFQNYPDHRHLNNHHGRYHLEESFPFLSESQQYRDFRTENISSFHRYNEDTMLNEIIPPSPLMGEKNSLPKTEEKNISDSLGYMSNEKKDDALEDDDSLIRQILMVNQEHLSTENDYENIILELNF